MLSILVISRSKGELDNLLKSIAESEVEEKIEVLVSWNAKDLPPLPSSYESDISLTFYHVLPYNFAKNNNRLARHASGEFLLFLNDDIVLDKKCLKNALSEIRKTEIGIVGANLRYADDQIQHAGIFFDDKRKPFHRFKHEIHYTDARILNDMFVPAVTGAFMLMRRSEFVAIKFDERFEVAGEDVCLSLAYRKKFGKGVLYCADATAVHRENVTRRQTEERDTPPGDLALIAEYASGEVGGVSLTQVHRPRVRIVTEKEGWIMHRKAAEIRRLFGNEYVKINEDWAEADIHYYINYGYFNKKPAKGVTIGNFTHFDPDSLADKFVETAFTVDHCTSVSELTTVKLQEVGIPLDKITTIRVGADAAFRPKLILGIAGRPYKGGRKGEDLLKALLDDPAITKHCQFVATNPDWGLTTLTLKDHSEFYRLIDFLLITARIEGGPVPFMEALACGTMSIAPQIGVVPEFAHIPYETGSIDSLKATIHRLVAEMLQTRGQVAAPMYRQNWEGWSVRHEKLFRRLLPGTRFS